MKNRLTATDIVGAYVFCSDPRDPLQQEAIDKLMPKNIGAWAPIALFGGPIALARQGPSLDPCCEIICHQIHFAAKNFPNFKTVILIGHDCGYYAEITEKEVLLPEKRNDIAEARRSLECKLTELGITIEIRAFFYEPDGSGFTEIK